MAFHGYLRLAALIGVLALARTGYADPPCLADMQKLCSNVPAGAGQVQACLKAHEADLSPGCKQHVDDLKRTAQGLAAKCIWDIQRFCDDVTPGGGRIIACLQQNNGDLSPVCKDALGQHKGQ